MNAPDPLTEYRQAFWAVFAEDNGLVNEWQLPPQTHFEPQDIKAGMIPIGSMLGVGLPS